MSQKHLISFVEVEKPASLVGLELWTGIGISTLSELLLLSTRIGEFDSSPVGSTEHGEDVSYGELRISLPEYGLKLVTRLYLDLVFFWV